MFRSLISAHSVSFQWFSRGVSTPATASWFLSPNPFLYDLKGIPACRGPIGLGNIPPLATVCHMTRSGKERKVSTNMSGTQARTLCQVSFSIKCLNQWYKKGTFFNDLFLPQLFNHSSSPAHCNDGTGIDLFFFSYFTFLSISLHLLCIVGQELTS